MRLTFCIFAWLLNNDLQSRSLTLLALLLHSPIAEVAITRSGIIGVRSTFLDAGGTIQLTIDHLAVDWRIGHEQSFRS
jgi:hypothetical protein